MILRFFFSFLFGGFALQKELKTHHHHHLFSILLLLSLSQLHLLSKKLNSPARRRGPQVVVALPRLRRLHGALRRRLRGLLLLRAVGHGGAHAELVLLRLHRGVLLGSVPHVGLCRVEEQPVFREGDVQGDQERVGGEDGKEGKVRGAEKKKTSKERKRKNVRVFFLSFSLSSSQEKRGKVSLSLACLLPSPRLPYSLLCFFYREKREGEREFFVSKKEERKSKKLARLSSNAKPPACVHFF